MSTDEEFIIVVKARSLDPPNSTACHSQL